jgi:hypothetical protein
MFAKRDRGVLEAGPGVLGNRNPGTGGPGGPRSGTGGSSKRDRGVSETGTGGPSATRKYNAKYRNVVKQTRGGGERRGSGGRNWGGRHEHKNQSDARGPPNRPGWAIKGLVGAATLPWVRDTWERGRDDPEVEEKIPKYSHLKRKFTPTAPSAFTRRARPSSSAGRRRRRRHGAHRRRRGAVSCRVRTRALLELLRALFVCALCVRSLCARCCCSTWH